MKKPREPRDRLKGISQGSKLLLPPEEFIREELERFGAISSERTWYSNLQGTLHPVFSRENWKAFDDKQYNALQQSFQLSTRLLKVGGPFFCNMLPKPQFPPKEPGDEDEDEWDEDSSDEFLKPWPRLIVKDDRSAEELREARIAFDALARFVTFKEHKTMMIKPGICGLIHDGTKDALVSNADMFDIDGLHRTADDNGWAYPRFNITIASQFVEALLSAPKMDTAEHMIAVFAAAITITHELAHAAWFSDTGHPGQKHLWIGKDVQMEHGLSCIAWLFGGWNPEITYIKGSEKEAREFKLGLAWYKWFQGPIDHPLARYRYSVPLLHVQRILMDESWIDYDLENLSSETSRRIKDELLRPTTPFRNGLHARAAKILFENQYMHEVVYDGFKRVEEECEDDKYFTNKSEAKVFVDEDWTEDWIPDKPGQKNPIHKTPTQNKPQEDPEWVERNEQQYAKEANTVYDTNLREIGMTISDAESEMYEQNLSEIRQTLRDLNPAIQASLVAAKKRKGAIGEDDKAGTSPRKTLSKIPSSKKGKCSPTHKVNPDAVEPRQKVTITVNAEGMVPTVSINPFTERFRAFEESLVLSEQRLRKEPPVDSTAPVGTFWGPLPEIAIGVQDAAAPKTGGKTADIVEENSGKVGKTLSKGSAKRTTTVGKNGK